MMRKNNLSFAGIVVGLILIAVLAEPACAEVKVLNNLVTQLLEVSQPPATPQASYTFTMPRDGWVFISSVVVTPATPGGSVYLILDADERSAAVIVHGPDTQAATGAVKDDYPHETSTLETIRRLPAGEHVLNILCDGDASVLRVVVRSIPEIIYPGSGYWSRRVIGPHTPYTWEYLQAIGITDNVNVILERHEDMGMDAQRWRAQGKKVLTHVSTHEVNALGKPITADNVYKVWSESDGFRRTDRDGIMFDEMDGYPGPGKEQAYGAYTEAVRRIFAQPQFKNKVIYPYCNVMYRSAPSRALFAELVKAGSKVTEDRYYSEMPTEDGAKSLAKSDLGYLMKSHKKKDPNAQDNIIWSLGYMSGSPETLNTNPGVNHRVFLDILFNNIANDPLFAGIYGIMCYHPVYADPETVRWSAKLFRHYGIEGRKDRLSSDPYILPHLQNPDFADGTSGWSVVSAEEGSTGTKSADGYGRLQGRYRGQSPQIKGQGDSFLWTKRSAKGPNTVSQHVKALVPGRLYSLKVLVADHQDLLAGESAKRFHQVGIQIENAELVPYKSFREVYGSKKLWTTYYFLVFRATTETAMLSISDWASDDPAGWPGEWGLQFDIGERTKPAKPDGPIGQELMFNFIELQPYLED
jgi:hypothetical protein